MNVYYAEGKEDLRLLHEHLTAATSVGFDLETTGLDPEVDSILLYQCATEREIWVVSGRLAREFPKAFDSALRVLAKREAIGHNLRFEYAFILAKHGLELQRIFDTQLAESLLTAGRSDLRTGLGFTLKRRLRVEADKDLQTSFIGQDPDTFDPTPAQLDYAATDVAHMHRLRDVQRDRLIQEGLWDTFQLELRVLSVFAAMEKVGMRLDQDCHRTTVDAYRQEATTLAGELDTILSPVWRKHAEEEYSRLQVQYLDRKEAVERRLYYAKKNPGGDLIPGSPEAKAAYKWRDEVKPKEDSRGFSLTSREKMLYALRTTLGWDAEQLPDMKKQTIKPLRRVPVLDLYARWATANKVVTSFGDTLAAKIGPDGRGHPHYNQLVSTGRTSSSDWNNQQLPPAIRRCFVPDPGHKFVVADFSNMELRIAAGLSGDPAMIDAFRNGWDVHRMTAAAAWPDRFASWEEVPKDSKERAAAKTVNFATIYGGTPYALYWRGLVETEELGTTVQEGFKAMFSTAWEWVQANGLLGLRQLWIPTAGGRKRYFRNPGPMPDADAPPVEIDGEEVPASVAWNRARKRIRRQAMNHPVQGTGADIAKEAMYLVHTGLRQRGIPGTVVGMVHDEIIVEVREEWAEEVATLVSASMERAGAIYVPALPIPGDVHIVERWEK